MQIVKISSKGQIVIPKDVRKKLGIQPRKFVILEIMKDHAILKPVPDIRKAVKGILKGKSSMKKALLREHFTEVHRDETVSL
jgi:AbrB family looped-hinge helix DNA binding protein